MGKCGSIARSSDRDLSFITCVSLPDSPSITTSHIQSRNYLAYLDISSSPSNMSSPRGGSFHFIRSVLACALTSHAWSCNGITRSKDWHGHPWTEIVTYFSDDLLEEREVLAIRLRHETQNKMSKFSLPRCPGKLLHMTCSSMGTFWTFIYLHI